MQKIILLSALLLSSSVFAAELQNYDEIQNAVEQGKTIHIAINLSQCVNTNTTKINSNDEHLAVYTPTAIQIAGDHIATSLLHFTLSNPEYQNKPIYEFMRYNIQKDNNLFLSYQTLNASNFAPLDETGTYKCKIGSDAKIFA